MLPGLSVVFPRGRWDRAARADLCKPAVAIRGHRPALLGRPARAGVETAFALEPRARAAAVAQVGRQAAEGPAASCAPRAPRLGRDALLERGRRSQPRPTTGSCAGRQVPCCHGSPLAPDAGRRCAGRKAAPRPRTGWAGRNHRRAAATCSIPEIRGTSNRRRRSDRKARAADAAKCPRGRPGPAAALTLVGLCVRLGRFGSRRRHARSA